MAFFGLTALGPQNSFEAQSAHHRTLQIFEDSDFQKAWESACGKRATFCRQDQLAAIFRVLFHGPVPQNDLDPLNAGFEEHFYTSETITFDQYMKIMDTLRMVAEVEESKYKGKVKPECEFISSSNFHESLKKNAAIKRNPREKLTAPLTGTQEVSCTFVILLSV